MPPELRGRKEEHVCRASGCRVDPETCQPVGQSGCPFPSGLVPGRGIVSVYPAGHRVINRSCQLSANALSDLLLSLLPWIDIKPLMVHDSWSCLLLPLENFIHGETQCGLDL